MKEWHHLRCRWIHGIDHTFWLRHPSLQWCLSTVYTKNYRNGSYHACLLVSPHSQMPSWFQLMLSTWKQDQLQPIQRKPKHCNAWKWVVKKFTKCINKCVRKDAYPILSWFIHSRGAHILIHQGTFAGNFFGNIIEVLPSFVWVCQRFFRQRGIDNLSKVEQGVYCGMRGSSQTCVWTILKDINHTHTRMWYKLYCRKLCTWCLVP